MSTCLSPSSILALFCAGLPGCSGDGSGRSPLFEEVTDRQGLPGPPSIWPDGLYRIPEISPGGIALFDYDGDGDLDLYQVCHPPPSRPEALAPDRLYRQEAGMAFVEVPGAAGLDDPGYGNGVALGDMDGDGDLDVFVANLGPDSLYRNEGNGCFTNVTARSGIRETGWSSSAAFLDYDRDGDLDLFVTRYLEDDPTRVCSPGLGEPRDYCGPARYQGVPDLLYRNDGHGTFMEVSVRAGIVESRPGFGVVCADLTGDGWVDIFVANDMQPNSLHVNQRDGTFIDRALEMGAALSGAGKPQAGMGVAAGDANGDGALDLFVTNLVDQTNTLYLHTGGSGANAGFRDRSASSGLGAPSLPFTAWGCGFQDFDHDGDLDVAVVNGRVSRGPVRPGAAVGPFWNAYAEPNQLFLNQGEGRYREAREGGDFTSRVEVTRTLAFGDLDRDGDVDLVTGSVGNGLRIYRNVGKKDGRRWLAVRALDGMRDALGALVTVEAGGRKQIGPILSAYSFQSAHEPVAHFGLGTAARVDRLEVLWPDGKRERFPEPAVDRAVTVREGEGEALR